MRTVFLPIEIKAREFRTKVAVGATLARRGVNVVIGEKYALEEQALANTSGGLFLHKGGPKASDLERLYFDGRSVVILDEELGPAIPFRSRRSVLLNRFPIPESSHLTKALFHDSDYAATALSSVGLSEGQVEVVGFPRLDLFSEEWRSCFETQADRIRGRLGEFLLFSSDFPVSSDAAFRSRLNALSRGNAADAVLDRETLMYGAFQKVRALLLELATDRRLPPIVVRPHPADFSGGWAYLCRATERMKCVYDGEYEAWILASSGVLHQGCTGAVQALAAGVNHCRLAAGDDGADPSFVSQLSAPCASVDEVIEELGHSDCALREHSRADWYRPGGSIVAVADCLEPLASKVEGRFVPTLRNQLRYSRGLTREYSRRRLRRSEISPPWIKVPGGLPVAEVDNMLNSWNMADRVNVSRIGVHLFQLSS